MPSIEVHVDGGAGWLLYGGRLVANVPATVAITPRPDDRDPLDFRVTMTIDVVAGRLGCTSLTADRLNDDAPGITGEDLRRIPVATYVEYAATSGSFTLMRRIDRGADRYEQVPVQRPPADFARNGMTDEALDQFAGLYAAVQATGGKPSGVLLSEYGMPRATFSRWLETARRRGVLREEHQRIRLAEGIQPLGFEYRGVVEEPASGEH